MYIFGHREIYNQEMVKAKLKEVLKNMIEEKRVYDFYVGNNGDFDNLVQLTLDELKTEYDYIDYTVVLAYLPLDKKQNQVMDFAKTIFPEGLENAVPKFAICRRNEWMINNSDYVISYVNRSFGGAFRYKSLAEKKGLKVIEIKETITKS